MKSKILGFSFLLTMLINILLSLTVFDIKVGDRLLVKIGTVTFSTINHTEYTMLCLLLIIMIIVGFWGGKHYLQASHPGLIKMVGFMLILSIIIFPVMQVYTNYLLLFLSRDINAVEYSTESICVYSLTSDNGNVDATYQITLINHGKDSISFNMKVQPPCGYSLVEVKETISGEEKLKTFSLSPKEAKTWLFNIGLQSPNTITQGTIKKPAIILFNNNNLVVPWSGTPPKDLPFQLE